MRSILLHVNDDACMEARLQVALGLAREFKSHLTCLQPVSYDFAVPGDLYGTMIAELLPVVRGNADKLRERLSARLANEDVPWDWQQEEGSIRPVLLGASALADLVVLGAHDPVSGAKGPSSLAGYLAIHARPPLLVVPPETSSVDLAAHAIVGWNGSMESANALRAAVPLLRKASGVTIVSVSEPEKSGLASPCLDAARYLSRHDIRSEIVEIDYAGQTVAEALASAASARGATYLVLGAYGHTRALQTIFGGVTRDLLCDPPLPIFTAH
jgi:nucleotide-binding universal stress UspA family protein